MQQESAASTYNLCSAMRYNLHKKRGPAHAEQVPRKPEARSSSQSNSPVTAQVRVLLQALTPTTQAQVPLLCCAASVWIQPAGLRGHSGIAEGDVQPHHRPNGAQPRHNVVQASEKR